MEKRVPMPDDVLARLPELQREYAALPVEERERIRLAALRSQRYLMHEWSRSNGK